MKGIYSTKFTRLTSMRTNYHKCELAARQQVEIKKDLNEVWWLRKKINSYKFLNVGIIKICPFCGKELE